MENKNIKRDSQGRFVSAKQLNSNPEDGIEIPVGYEIDIEKLKSGKILLRKKEVKKWEDIPILNGCFIGYRSLIRKIKHAKTNEESRNVFIDTLHAKRAIAEAQISQLMPYYGGEITPEEWRDKTIPKFAYVKKCGFEMFDIFKLVVTCDCYHFLSFHTTNQASEFFENNKEIIMDYFMMAKK